MRARTVVVGIVAVLGVVVGVLWGWSALAIYAFLAAIAAAIGYAAGLGGEWVRDVSSRRFDDRP